MPPVVKHFDSILTAAMEPTEVCAATQRAGAKRKAS